MLNPDLQIRIGALAKLESALPDYTIRDSMFLPDDEMPGILLSSQTMNQDQLKTEFGGQSTLLIQVIGKKSISVNRYEIDLIAEEVMKAIIPIESANYISVNGYQVVSTTLDSLNDSVIQENDGASARKLIRIRFLLRQLNNN